MKVLLLFIPFITTAFGLFIYRFQGSKREVFRLDIVHFLNLFVLAPTMFVWIKSFIFFVLRNEIEGKVTLTEMFVIDTAFSVIAFMLIAALAIHTLTRTFKIKRLRDADFDLYHFSEYFHLWWSHIVLIMGTMVVLTFISVINIFVPLHVDATRIQFYALLAAGLVFGVLMFAVIWITDAMQANYMRLMKLILGFFFLINVALYFIFDPLFSVTSGVYWFVSSVLFAAVFSSLFVDKYQKTKKARNFLVGQQWGNNIQLFANQGKKSKKKNMVSFLFRR